MLMIKENFKLSCNTQLITHSMLYFLKNMFIFTSFYENFKKYLNAQLVSIILLSGNKFLKIFGLCNWIFESIIDYKHFIFCTHYVGYIIRNFIKICILLKVDTYKENVSIYILDRFIMVFQRICSYPWLLNCFDLSFHPFFIHF